MRRSLPLILVGAAVLALVVLAVGACGGSDVGSDTDDSLALQGKSWKATAIDGVESVLEAKEFSVTARFADGQMSGSATVNRYNASYSTGPGNTIELGMPISTEMAGPQEAMDQETAYLAAIQKAATYEVSADSLTLLDENEEVLVEYEVAPAAELTGTAWQAIAYNNGKGALQSLAIDSAITATFGEDGTLAGNASVNQYTTQYSVSGDDQMTINAQIVTTKMAGPDELMAQEAAYLAALPQTATYEIDGDTLWLRDAEGAALAQYLAE